MYSGTDSKGSKKCRDSQVYNKSGYPYSLLLYFENIWRLWGMGMQTPVACNRISEGEFICLKKYHYRESAAQNGSA